MSSIALGCGDVVVGVDTHKDEHVAVALDGLGGRLGELAIAATPNAYAELVAWADQLGAVAVFGVEGTGAYGLRHRRPCPLQCVEYTPRHAPTRIRRRRVHPRRRLHRPRKQDLVSTFIEHCRTLLDRNRADSA